MLRAYTSRLTMFCVVKFCRGINVKKESDDSGDTKTRRPHLFSFIHWEPVEGGGVGVLPNDLSTCKGKVDYLLNSYSQSHPQ
jgi:hypothetical protein